MQQTMVSVIIPAYNNAEFLGEAIESVLDQTYPNFEVIVVNDASPDDTYAVVSQYPDSRVRYIVHEQNMGLSAARNTGMRASRGELIALLDGDDLFHSRKLQAHVDFLDLNPEVGVTYNSRYELNHSARTIRELWRPPDTVGLVDLFFGFPFGPSDMVMRRECAFEVDLFDNYYVYVGEDLDINLRLALAGFQFANVGGVHNSRRYHSGRIMGDLRGGLINTMKPLKSAFADSRCPARVAALQEKVFASHIHLWSAIAFTQQDTEIGQEFLLDAIRRDSSLLDGRPNQIVKTLIMYSIADESEEHDQLLRSMFDQLPAQLSWLANQIDWAVARGDLIRGTRASMWGRIEDAKYHFGRARALGAQIDDDYSQYLIAQLLAYESEFGFEATQEVTRSLFTYLEEIGSRTEMRWLKGHCSFNNALQHYHSGQYAKVPRQVMHAFANDPSHLKNRGALSMLFRSLVAMRTQP